MPKGSHNMPGRSAPPGKGRRSRKKRQRADGPVLSAAQRVTPQARVSVAPSARREAAPVQQNVASYAHVLGELKRSGIIAGAMLILLIVLSVLPLD
ncbi:MAG: hypothetical protein ISS53_00995 [Dehalococcoidia bacterium]|nr:hypothetical protein [Dehalococcoidia bacterium]